MSKDKPVLSASQIEEWQESFTWRDRITEHEFAVLCDLALSEIERQGSGKWVPLEPTPEMLEAAKPAFKTIDSWCAEMQLIRGRKKTWKEPPLVTAYRAMLAAAPQAQDAQTGEGK